MGSILSMERNITSYLILKRVLHVFYRKIDHAPTLTINGNNLQFVYIAKYIGDSATTLRNVL